ncbi:MAG: GatB/YqeY domain-containing protein [Schleiferiaceae bacterium]
MSIEALEAQLTEDMKTAMRAKDQVRLEAVRSIRAALTTEKTSAANQGSLTEAQAIAVLQRLKKQRVESAEIFNTQDRKDLAEVEEAQLAVIQGYLPAALEGAELTAAVRDLLAQHGFTNAAQFGQAMGLISKALAGRADGKAVSAEVKALLS